MESEDERVDQEKPEPSKEKVELSRNGGEKDEVGAEEAVSLTKDMELGELHLEGLEKVCENPKEGYIPFTQIILLQEALIKTKGSRGLGVVPESMKGGESKHRGSRSNLQRIQDVGGKLVASRKYPTINEAFNLLTKNSQ